MSETRDFVKFYGYWGSYRDALIYGISRGEKIARSQKGTENGVWKLLANSPGARVLIKGKVKRTSRPISHRVLTNKENKVIRHPSSNNGIFKETKVTRRSQPGSKRGLIKEDLTQRDFTKEAKVLTRPSSNKGIFKETKVTRRSQHSSRRVLMKEELKVSSQSSSQRDLTKEAKVIRGIFKATSLKIGMNQTNSPQEPGVEPVTVPKVMSIALAQRRKCREVLKENLKKMTRHEQNLLILKKFLKVSQQKKGGNEGVFFATSFPSRTNVKRVEKMVKKMATKLAMVSLRRWMLDGFPDFKLNMGSSNFYEAFVECSFKCVADFILLTFDVEDLERFNYGDKILAEYERFEGENLSHISIRGENPYMLAAEGKINFDGFPLLREQDVAFIFQGHMQFSGRLFHVHFMNFGFLTSKDDCFEASHHDRFVEMARTVLLLYVPMEDNLKMRSIHDVLVGPCGLTFDAHCQETFYDLFRILESEKCHEILALRIVHSLSTMIRLRYRALKALLWDKTHALRFGGPFGPFSKEVIDFVGVADARRRFLAHRFISKDHILWAVGLTGFKDFVDRLVEGIGLRRMVEEPATCPPYSIYMNAQTIAKFHGSKVVAIEHIVLATLFEMSRTRFIIEFNDSECVKKFIDAVREYREEIGDKEYLRGINFLDKPEVQSSDSSLSESDADNELGDYRLEYVNRNKIKNLRKMKKSKDYRWSW